jgi:hypothetical protein
MRLVLAFFLCGFVSSTACAQEYEDAAATASISRAEDSCGSPAKLDLNRWKDFAETLSPSRPRRSIGH